MMQGPALHSANRLPAAWLAQAAVLALCTALLAGPSGSAQAGPTQPRPMLPQPIGQSVGGEIDEQRNGNSIQNEKMLRALNADRQKSLVADTDRLLRLVNELNAEISRANPESLTPAQLRKVAEIEKLAHNVKDKMSTSVQCAPPFQQPSVKMR